MSTIEQTATSSGKTNWHSLKEMTEPYSNRFMYTYDYIEMFLKRDLGFYAERGALYTAVGRATRMLLPGDFSHSAHEPLFEGAMIGAVGRLLPLDSPLRYFPTTRRHASCVEVDHQPGR